MLRKIGIPVVALFAMLAFAAPRPASAGVRFGVGIYGAPARVYVAPPVYPAPYVAPAYPYPYAYAPGYAYPGVGIGLGFGYGGGYGYNRGYYGHGYVGGGHAYGGRGFAAGHRR